MKLDYSKTLIGDINIINKEKLYFKIPDNYDVLVKVKDKVKMNTILANSSNNTSIISSVSGVVESIENNIITIKNDFKEEKEEIDTNIDFIELLKDSGIVGMGGAGFPTYKKYNVDKIDTLIVNAVECEPFIMSDYVLVSNYAKEIIESIKRIMKIKKIKNVIIAYKKEKKLDIYLKPYLTSKITLKPLKNVYPMGWERKLIKEVLNVTYDKIPIEKGIVVSNVGTIKAIGDLMSGNRLTSRIITIASDEVKSYLVKIGTDINELLTDYNLKNKEVIIGGPMMGKTSYDYVSATTNSILILDKNEMLENPCIRCGKCVSVCPVGLEPVLIKDNLNNKDKLKNLRSEKCIECGLCSYICPSKIDLRSKVIEAKRR